MKKRKVALITGITGQDGSYLAELLLSKNYIVHGIKRRSSSFNTERIDHIYQDPHSKKINFKLHYGDLTDSLSIIRIINEIQPDEIYNLGAMSHVKVSFENPEYVANVDALGTLRILESVRSLKMKKVKIYQASSSELYGKVQEIPQTENTQFYPRSPYAVAKLYSYWITINYREAYDIFACNGILFNHESPRRGETFVTRKITRGICKIILGIDQTIFMGNLNAKRDWGHAKDYVMAMYLILQQNKPDDYVISTGITTSIRDFIILCFEEVGLKIKFFGSGVNEIGCIKEINKLKFEKIIGAHHINTIDELINNKVEIIKVDKSYYRPTEVDLLIGDSSKARKKLNWNPTYNLRSLAKEMLVNDFNYYKSKGKYAK